MGRSNLEPSARTVRSYACDTILVTAGGRGYIVRLWMSGDGAPDAGLYDSAWLRSVAATMQLDPEDAVDTP